MTNTTKKNTNTEKTVAIVGYRLLDWNWQWLAESDNYEEVEIFLKRSLNNWLFDKSEVKKWRIVETVLNINKNTNENWKFIKHIWKS